MCWLLLGLKIWCRALILSVPFSWTTFNETQNMCLSFAQIATADVRLFLFANAHDKVCLVMMRHQVCPFCVLDCMLSLRIFSDVDAGGEIATVMR